MSDLVHPREEYLGESYYLAFVRNLPCLSCGTDQHVVAHHYMENDGGTALKVSDFNTVPLCSTTPEQIGCHEFWHQHLYLPCHADLPEQDAWILSRLTIYRAQARQLAQWMTVF